MLSWGDGDCGPVGRRERSVLAGRADGLDNSHQVVAVQVGSAGQAEALLEEPAGDVAAAAAVAGEDRLQVHRLPDGRDSMFSRSRARRMSSRVAPNCSGSTVMQVSQRVDRPWGSSGMKAIPGRPPSARR